MQSGNALITHHSGEWYCNTDNRTPANASKLRQGHHALGVDGKLLTELLGGNAMRLESNLGILWENTNHKVKSMLWKNSTDAIMPIRFYHNIFQGS